MKFYHLFPILHLLWKIQAYAGHESVYLPRDHIPASLQTRHIESKDSILSARGLETAGSDIQARGLLQGSLVKRMNPDPATRGRSRSPQRQRGPQLAPPAGERYPSPSPSARTPRGLKQIAATNPGLSGAVAAGGLVATGLVAGMASATNWHEPSQAAGAAVSMACLGGLAFTAACAAAKAAVRHGTVPEHETMPHTHARPAGGVRASAGSATGGRGDHSASELQTVPLIQGPSRLSHQPDPNDPSDLVRRFVY